MHTEVVHYKTCIVQLMHVAVNFEEHVNTRKRGRHFPVCFYVRKRRNTSTWCMATQVHMHVTVSLSVNS